MKTEFSRLLALTLCLFSGHVGFQTTPAHALSVFDLGDLSALTQPAVDAMVKTIAIGADHRDYQPASSLGLLPGLDLSADLTMINLPTEFTDALTLATGQAPSLTSIPLPRLNIHKGLPGGFDLGFTWIALPVEGKTNSLLGASLQWSFFRSSISAPTLALRGSYATATLPALFMSTSTMKFDLVASKSIFIIEPYVGGGLVSGSGTLDLSSGTGSLPISVTADSSVTTGHVFVGLPIKLFIMKLTVEYDQTFAGVSTYGLKAGLKF